jgi:hypothetical protein
MGQMIGARREYQGLYQLTLPSSLSAFVSVVSPLLHHNRLGHPSLSKLQKMGSYLPTISSLECESCQLGKHTLSSFLKQVNHRATSPFELVHTNVLGPSRILTTLGYKYFVTFIDDFLRCTLLFLMKSRSDIFFVFQTFCA